MLRQKSSFLHKFACLFSKCYETFNSIKFSKAKKHLQKAFENSIFAHRCDPKKNQIQAVKNEKNVANNNFHIKMKENQEEFSILIQNLIFYIESTIYVDPFLLRICKNGEISFMQQNLHLKCFITRKVEKVPLYFCISLESESLHQPPQA